ncbi:gamma-glutamylcyclotransferase family protein [Alkaliphilus peptidifermentans]|uniref:Uncharacterized conserved protein YtfP, gamma-glutamylcyclotransferase (GGCT)/AIG2-like family n=1 Tax=Alkaliphilus peptidifermentans DSM 18978 TaxID=1120976 RepID=A0A1G5K8X4_9FIRM|nr:gamma-glutamylcyclotransferase family protein [Alkaliphilus peptidifermentans]SCY96977.1 Uncharacterized conserved protein YtfP, gamma-glutamylcyclotransferase (GGCT)/AIG2-like family [Alkaliphilus peptidifermentans DSM 18978]
MIQKLFVYGSLMENFYNYNRYLKGKVLTRNHVRTRGALYHLIDKGYPAMIEGNDFIYGELIEVEDWGNTLRDLDTLENYYGERNINNEYNRVLIEVETIKGEHKGSAYTYKYSKQIKDTFNALYIPYGDWRRYMQVL